ncbi:MAG: glycan-binding surface protein [Paludibacteraceae bacterium]
MKNIKKIIPAFLIALAVMSIFSACDKNADVNPKPEITYVRVTKPESSDSLLVSALQGQLIAIVGKNLQGAQEVWFNDQRANLTPTYITNTSILVSIPTAVPQNVNNKLKIYFSDGDSLLYNFTVAINKPTITGMDCEYIPAGGTAVIHGNYFYQPLTVTFAGGASVDIKEVPDPTILNVVIPEGAQPGQITIKSNFGETKSDFWFRDTRNIFVSSDPYSGWWNSSFVVNAPGTADVPSINGNYIRVVKTIGSWSWMEIAGGPASAMGDISKNIPDEAILKPSLYNFKFELCTVKPYNNNGIRMCVGAMDGDHGDYNFNPPIDTKGKWQTIIIPFEDVIKSYPHEVNPDGYYTRFVFIGAGELDCDMSFDNFRVVPKTIKP